MLQNSNSLKGALNKERCIKPPVCAVAGQLAGSAANGQQLLRGHLAIELVCVRLVVEPPLSGNSLATAVSLHGDIGMGFADPHNVLSLEWDSPEFLLVTEA
ncbi:hypothetical protein [Rhodopirellula sp. P2]|uniref:hypothetical protein n=1 Tax=Rhodopirellula sp. P2 TaxID=2127060 RepID=UPI00236783E9|nr:hypothetical protein [Rhodopirellula sp. P2]WDQ15352.1 hypothetical protein PSR62_17115 [Rhodopirellula sp. P2]